MHGHAGGDMRRYVERLIRNAVEAGGAVSVEGHDHRVAGVDAMYGSRASGVRTADDHVPGAA
jgi:hypothetical protein